MQVVVVQHEWQRQLILSNLQYSGKHLGPYLRGPIPELQLLAQDRLEPSEDLVDTGVLDSVQLPVVVYFMRGDVKSCRVLHTCPWFRLPGVGLQSWAIDPLHTWHLGPLGDFVAKAIWFFLLNHIHTGPVPWLEAEQARKLSLLQLKAELHKYYRRRARENDTEWSRKGSSIWNITFKMLGKPGAPLLSAKAAETVGLLDFVVEQLTEHSAKIENMKPAAKLEGDLLLRAGRVAQHIEKLLNEMPPVMSAELQQELLDHFVRFGSLVHRAGMALKPKYHLLLHMCRRTSRSGNPRFSGSTYRDESLNGVVAAIARSCHRWTFGIRVHQKLWVLDTLARARASKTRNS